jgi:hypothetical protein
MTVGLEGMNPSNQKRHVQDGNKIETSLIKLIDVQIDTFDIKYVHANDDGSAYADDVSADVYDDTCCE